MAIVLDPISPVAFSVFGIPVRWYALAYVVGFVLGFWLLKKLTQKDDSEIYLTRKQLDDLLTYLVFGIILGGRLGYVLFITCPFSCIIRWKYLLFGMVE